VSDDLARMRSRRANAAAPQYPAPVPFDTTPVGRDCGKRLKANVTATHELQVKEPDMLSWEVVHRGSEAACLSELDVKRRHWPQNQWRVVTLAEAAADRRHKTWSVRDSDHVPKGSRVMLARPPAAVHPEQPEILGAVRRAGLYMVQLEGTSAQTTVSRGDLIYPVPQNVVPLEPRSSK